MRVVAGVVACCLLVPAGGCQPKAERQGTRAPAAASPEPPPAPEPTADPEAVAVVDAVQQLFFAMQTRNRETLDRVLAPDARLAAVETGKPVRVTTGADFVKAVMGGTGEWLERMWDVNVDVYGDLATVSGPYEFIRDGTRSHCGVNAVHLVRHDADWQIVAITYTRRTDRCDPTPGPLVIAPAELHIGAPGFALCPATVDGRPVGDTPLKIAVLPGPHDVVRTWDDGTTFAQTVTVEPGSRKVVRRRRRL